MINFDKKDVITALNREEAEIYIGEKGYYCYRNNDWRPCELVRVYLKDDDFDVRNVFTILDHKTEHECPMFLPADKVKEVEEPKKWRTFKDLNDFKTYAKKSVGSVLIYRKKNKNHTMNTSMITNYVFDTNCISLGNLPFSFETLFDEYEWLDEHGIWKPFGVLDE